MTLPKKYRIAIFASGNGSNAQRIAEYFSEKTLGTVALIITNRKEAFVLERAKQLGIPGHYFTKEQFLKGDDILSLLHEQNIDFVVLAGFLLLVPTNIIEAFPNAIINIHPALLPKYGGKGMYGQHVHEAVMEAGEKESGITIHFVNENYDDGAFIFQTNCTIVPGDTSEILAEKIHQLEYKYFPKIIEKILTERKESELL